MIKHLIEKMNFKFIKFSIFSILFLEFERSRCYTSRKAIKYSNISAEKVSFKGGRAVNFKSVIKNRRPVIVGL